MTDPLSITAGVIAVVTLAYDSGKTLYEFINGILEAPKALKDMNGDLAAIQKVLNSLKVELEGTPDATLSAGLKKFLNDIKPSLEGCTEACDEFKAKLVKVTSHSTEAHTSKRDRIKLQFQDKEISAFKYRMASYKATLSIALEYASLKTTTDNSKAIQALESKIEIAMTSISGQIQGVEIGMQALSDFDTQKNELMAAMEQQSLALAQCLKACTTALSSTSESSGHKYLYTKAIGNAIQLVGNVGQTGTGGTSHTYSQVIGENDAQQVVGDVEGQIALAMFRQHRQDAKGSG